MARVSPATQLSLPDMPSTPDDTGLVSGLRYAGTGRRFTALLLDVLVLFFTMPVWLLPFIAVPYGGAAGIATGVPGYFAVTFLRGRSIGMRIMGIHLERADGGGRPRYTQAIVRGVLGGLPVAALVLLLAAGFSDQPDEGYSAAETVFIGAAALIFLAGLLARLTMTRDPRHQSLVDRAAGVVVVVDPPKG